MVRFPLVALAEILVAFLGFGVWAHHMFAVGLSTLTTVYFAAASLIIVIPSGDPAVRLDHHDRHRHARTSRRRCCWIVGFIVFFIIGGLIGDHVRGDPVRPAGRHDTYFVVAHFHFVIFGAAVFPILGGMYYWFPKVTGPDVPRARRAR